jgi:cysteinyl-tRNA synthetase
MALKHLGAQFDIHGGGKDLVFPHHENEIAQSWAANGVAPVRCWMHNGFVNVNEEKMAKSLGNFFTIREVLGKYHSEALRLFLLGTHYRSPINFSDQNLQEATQRAEYVYETLARVDCTLALAPEPTASLAGVEDHGALDAILPAFTEAMDDDFNTAQALGSLSEPLKLANELADRPATPGRSAALRALRDRLSVISGVLGVFGKEPKKTLCEIQALRKGGVCLAESDILCLIEARKAARAARSFARADEIRKELLEKGVEIRDTPHGTTWKYR